jgi:hypothetical protein
MPNFDRFADIGVAFASRETETLDRCVNLGDQPRRSKKMVQAHLREATARTILAIGRCENQELSFVCSKSRSARKRKVPAGFGPAGTRHLCLYAAPSGKSESAERIINGNLRGRGGQMRTNKKPAVPSGDIGLRSTSGQNGLLVSNLHFAMAIETTVRRRMLSGWSPVTTTDQLALRT